MNRAGMPPLPAEPPAMTHNNAEQELHRIEQELNAKAASPAPESRVAKINRTQPHFDAVLIGVVALLAAAFLLPLSKSLSDKDVDALSAGALGGSIGLAVGYVIGRVKR